MRRDRSLVHCVWRWQRVYGGCNGKTRMRMRRRIRLDHPYLDRVFRDERELHALRCGLVLHRRQRARRGLQLRDRRILPCRLSSTRWMRCMHSWQRMCWRAQLARELHLRTGVVQRHVGIQRLHRGGRYVYHVPPRVRVRGRRGPAVRVHLQCRVLQLLRRVCCMRWQRRQLCRVRRRTNLAGRRRAVVRVMHVLSGLRVGSGRVRCLRGCELNLRVVPGGLVLLRRRRAGGGLRVCRGHVLPSWQHLACVVLDRMPRRVHLRRRRRGTVCLLVRARLLLSRWRQYVLRGNCGTVHTVRRGLRLYWRRRAAVNVRCPGILVSRRVRLG